MSGYAKRRAKERIAWLAGHGMDLVTFWQECTAALAPAVPHYLGPCWFTLDPASLLVTSHFQESLAEIPHEWLAQEYYADDFNKMADVARSARGRDARRAETPALAFRHADNRTSYRSGTTIRWGRVPGRRSGDDDWR
jgi:hypothetical protein